MPKTLALGLITMLLAAAACVNAGVIDAGGEDGRVWFAWGGETRFHFNPDDLARLGLRIAAVDGATSRTRGVAGVRYESIAFSTLDSASLQILHEGEAITALGGGALRHAGGLVLAAPARSIDLRGFAVQAGEGTRIAVDIVDAGGRVWLTADHAHYGFDDAARTVFSLRNMNLRIAPALAAALGRPDAAGQPIGGLDIRAHALAGTKSAPTGGICGAPWPDPPASHADVQMVLGDFSGFEDAVYVKRCSGCTSTSTTGRLVVNPDSSLENAGTTGVAWYAKFSGAFPPYGNDQHPFLIWNLYRIGMDGSIRQIGASGVKHAFYTVNYGCGCAAGHVLFPTCADVYSSFNNDSSSDLGPRSEIVPHEGLWGRCGSVYDADCNGVEDAGGGASDLYEFRMNVSESDLLPPLANGARYLIEYWYVARDDDTFANSIASREVAFHKTGSSWSVAPVASDFRLGPAIDDWVDPDAPPAASASRDLSTPLGHVRVAVRASDLGGGAWRYRYAVMNLDYAHAEIDPAHPGEPNLGIASSHGLRRFSVPVPSGVTAIGFADADADAANDWTASVSGGRVTWTAPSTAAALDWGMLDRFDFTVTSPPLGSGTVRLSGVATASEPGSDYDLAILVPAIAGDTIFLNGFD